ncbi:MAG: DUF1624 domain-containing protein [Methanomicrobia archaeon]|nr:DUF1624 domain-containing protein [Methanomicrobia archaeon]
MTRTMDERLWELDALRGIAILMMIAFHVLFDLDYFGIATFDVKAGFWFYFARATATIFLLLVGISLTLSYSRALQHVKKPEQQKLYRKYLTRGSKIFAWGLVITAMTRIFLRDGFVVWGILHCIGISIIVAYPVVKLRYGNLVLGLGLVALGMYVKSITVTLPWLLWLGVTPDKFHSVDYFPILPWLGVVLIGVFLGNSLYTNYTRGFKLHDRSQVEGIRLLRFLGRHSLLIYLIHQPLLITALYLIDLVTTGTLGFL